MNYPDQVLGLNISFGAAYRLARALEMDFVPSLRRTRHKLASTLTPSKPNSNNLKS